MSKEDVERKLPNSQLYSASSRQIATFRRQIALGASTNIGPLKVDYTTFTNRDAQVLGVRVELPGVYKEDARLVADQSDILFPQPIVVFLVQRWPFLEFISRSGRIEYWLERRGEEPIHLVSNNAAIKAVDEMRIKITPHLQAVR